MTKLEQKLIELGYEIQDTAWTYKQTRNRYFDCFVYIQFLKKENKINYYGVKPIFSIKTQQDIDNLQQAFNQLQNDLKELNMCENNN